MEPAVQGLQTAVTLAVYVASCLSGLSKGPWNQPLPRDICLSRGLPGLGFRLYVEVAFGKSQGSHWPSHCVYLYQAAELRPHD